MGGNENGVAIEKVSEKAHRWLRGTPSPLSQLPRAPMPVLVGIL
jgi:hypothetical protein